MLASQGGRNGLEVSIIASHSDKTKDRWGWEFHENSVNDYFQCGSRVESCAFPEQGHHRAHAPGHSSQELAIKTKPTL